VPLHLATALNLHHGCEPHSCAQQQDLGKAQPRRTNDASWPQGMANIDLKAGNTVLVWDPLLRRLVATTIDFGDVSCGEGHPRGLARTAQMDPPEAAEFILQAKRFVRREKNAFIAMMKEQNIALDSAECMAAYNKHFDPARIIWLFQNEVSCCPVCSVPPPGRHLHHIACRTSNTSQSTALHRTT
jgi:hypothetical protein